MRGWRCVFEGWLIVDSADWLGGVAGCSGKMGEKVEMGTGNDD